MKSETKIKLEWVRCQNRQYCDLMNVNLDHDHFDDLEGVYLIWFTEPKGRVVRVGQGVIRARLKEHRENPKINRYAKDRKLYVSWAEVNKNLRDGIEAYLAKAYNPLEGERYPDATPIPVNAPWDD